nr:HYPOTHETICAL 229.9KD PROTEIN IN NUC1-PRP21 INTERGENIC REGION [Schizosaccharomyces pombe]
MSLASLPLEKLTKINQQETFIRFFFKYSKTNLSYGVRSIALDGLSKCIETSIQSTNEDLIKEIWKCIKSNLNTSSTNVLLSALRCAYYILGSSRLRNSELEWFKSFLFKKSSIDNSLLHSSLGRCFSALASAQADKSIEAAANAVPSTPADDENNEEVENRSTTRRFDETESFRHALRILVENYHSKHAKYESSKAVLVFAVKHLFLMQRPSFVSLNYTTIVDIILLHQSHSTSKEWLSSLEQYHCTYLFRDVIGRRFLDQSSELQGIEILLKRVLEPYLKDQSKISEIAVKTAMASTADILSRSKGSATALYSQLLDTTLQILYLGKDSLKNEVAWLLRCLLSVMPSPLMPTLLALFNRLELEFKHLRSKPKEVSPKLNVGIFNNLTLSLMSIYVAAEENPLYVASSIFSKLFNFSLDLIKSSSKLDLLAAQAQIKTGWRLLSAYVSFGPSFTRMQLSQLLILWKNALSRVPSKIHSQNFMETNADMFNRFEALQCLLSFLEYNKILFTPDVRKRVIIFLNNCLKFYKAFSLTKRLEITMPIPASDYSHLELRSLLLARIFQCFFELSQLSGMSLDDQELLSTTVSTIAELSSLQGYDTADEIVQAKAFTSPRVIPGIGSRFYAQPEEEFQTTMDDILPCYICESSSDSLSVISRSNSAKLPYVPPSLTSLIDNAIQLFASMFCHQPPKVMESTLEIMVASVTNLKSGRDILRYKAVTANTLFSIYGFLSAFDNKKVTLPDKVVSLMIELLENLTAVNDPKLIPYISKSYAFLAYLYQSKPTSVLDTIIKRAAESGDPNCRAVLILAVGHILKKVGSGVPQTTLITAYQLLKVFNTDSNDLVRECSIRASSVSLGSIAKTIPSVLTAQTRILLSYMLLPECDIDVQLLKKRNSLFFPSTLFANYLDCLINELGPNLRSDSSTSHFAFDLAHQLLLLSRDTGDNIIHVYKCYQHLYLFTPLETNSDFFIRELCGNIIDLKQPKRREISIEVLYQILLQNHEFSESCYKRHFDRLIWQSLDTTPDNKLLKNILYIWLNDYKDSDIHSWVNILLFLVGIKNTSSSERSNEQDIQNNLDEDTVSLAYGTSENASNPLFQKNYRWQTQFYAATCLKTCISEVMAENKEPAKYLISRISDLVRAAFVLSTSDNFYLKQGGFELLDTIITDFSNVMDPDFDDVSLLDQFQAQISSAFSSAFVDDSSPEIVAMSLNIASNFIGTGLLKTESQAAKILNLLKEALESSLPERAGFEENRHFKYDSKYFLRIATLSAWASLLVHSANVSYLKEFLSSNIRRLSSHWIMALRGYSRLQFGPSLVKDFVADTSFTRVQSINPKILLNIYEKSWLNIAESLTILLSTDANLIYGILSGDELSLSEEDVFFQDNINYASNRYSFNFFLFSVCFQSLLIPSTLQGFRNPVFRIMRIMTEVLTEELCTKVLYDHNVFPEVVDLLVRLILTEDWETKASIVIFVKKLALANPAHNDLKFCETDSVTSMEPTVSESVEMLFQLVKILTLALTVRVPGLRSDPAESATNKKASEFVILCFNAFLDVSNIFPAIVRVDLFATAMHVYEVIMDDQQLLKNSKQELLAALRKLLSTMVEQNDHTCTTLIYTLFEHLLNIYKETINDSDKKEKNETAFMSMVLVLTLAAPILDSEQLVVHDFLEELFSSLKSSEEDFALRTRCVTSLMLVNSKHPSMSALCRFIIYKSVTMLQNGEVLKSGDYVTEFIPALLDMHVHIPEEKKKSFLSMSIPIAAHFSILVEHADARKRIGEKLLKIMAIQPDEAKAIIQQLSPRQKKCVEEILIQNVE